MGSNAVSGAGGLNLRWHPSPNFGERRHGAKPSLVVLHYTAMGPSHDALARLCDPQYEVSAHYLIARTGELWQLVAEDKRAWHAGAGCWGTINDVNSHSIGIELSNDGSQAYPYKQICVLRRLLFEICARWAIPPERVIGHSDCAPGRKIDPGVHFDWQYLAQWGLSVWPQRTISKPLPPLEMMPELLSRIGYDRRVDFDTILAAFRMRYSPRLNGPLNAADLARAADLAARFPVDRSIASV